MILWSLRAAALILVGALLALVLRRRSAAMRCTVLRATLVAAWALPLLVLVAPRVAVPLPRVPAVAPRSALSLIGKKVTTPMPITEGWSVVQSKPGDASTLGFVRQTPFSTAWVPATVPFFVVWLLGAGFLLLRWVAGFVRLVRLRRLAEPTQASGVWYAAIAVPATYGRTILLPWAAREWPESRVRAALLHEGAHVRRLDWAWQTLAAAFAALHWANPLGWLLARLLRDAAEAAADDAVLAQGVAPSDYARELLAVAASVGSTGPALAMARWGGVKERVAAVLSDRRDRRGPSRTFSALSSAGLFACGVGFAGLALASKVAPSSALGDGAPVVLLPGGGTVRLLAIREPSPKADALWSPAGGSLPQADKALLLRTLLLRPRNFPAPPQGVRRLQFLFVPIGASVDPTQFTLSQRGGEIFRTVGSDGQEFPVAGAPFALHCDVPDSLDLVDLEARFPAGPWRREPAAWPTMTGAHEDIDVRGHWVPVEHAQGRPARFSADRSYRLVVKDATGRTLREAWDTGFSEGRVDGLVPKGTPFARLAVESRPFVRASFPSVRLRPRSSASPARLASGHSVELAGVWSPDGVEGPWGPDGSRSDLERVGNYDGTVPTGMRAVLFAFRVRGSGTRVPTVQVRAAFPGAAFESSSLSLLLDEEKSLLVWVRTLVPERLRETSLDVDLKLEGDDVGPPLPLGKKPGQATVVVASVDVRPEASYAQLRVTPHVPMDPTRFWYGVSPVDAQGGSPESFGYQEPGPTFQISMAHPECAVAWRLWRCPRERARFDAVHLRPSP